LLQMEPERLFVVDHEGKTYRIEIYPMQSGSKTYHYYQPPTQYSAGTSYSTTESVTNDYAFIFDGDKLIYWGFLYELQKCENELVVELAPIVSSRLKGKDL